MDSNIETDFVNDNITAALESPFLEIPFHSTFLPDPSDDTDESLSHLVKKIEAIGISELFKKLNTNARNCVIAYVIMFIIGAPGNLYVFLSVGHQLWKRRWRRSSRIKVLIWHLAFADLFVTFFVIPIEIFWRLTIQWYGGNNLCKSIQFFRTFGLYLSSMVIITISLDRCFAIVFPLKVIGGMKRIRNMLITAWISSILFAAPQVMVFSVQKHPLYPSFRFCTNSHYFPSFNKEILYNLLSLVVMYFAPLLVIIITYAMVFFTISSKSREHRQQNSKNRRSSMQLRRSDNAWSQITRARNKAMWITMLIVTVFVLCWTPFVVMTLWYMLDFETAEKLLDPRIQEALFVTAVSNSCLNPIIYGNYMKRCWRCIFLCSCPQVLGNSLATVANSTTVGTSSRTHQHIVMSSSIAMGVSGRKISANSHPV